MIGVRRHRENLGWVMADIKFPNSYIGKAFRCVENSRRNPIYNLNHIYVLEGSHLGPVARCPKTGRKYKLNAGWFVEVGAENLKIEDFV